MYFSDLLLPFKRQKQNVIITFLLLFCLIFTGIILLPPIERTTVYFSLKPLISDNTGEGTFLVSNGIEEGGKVAETIAGWSQNPAFREEIMQKAGIEIDNFKNKLSAQRQNRLNVFWRVTLYGSEIQHSSKITNALIQTFEKDFADFNANNAFPFGYSDPSIFVEKKDFPLSWKVLASIFGAGFLTIVSFFLIGSGKGKLLFAQTVRDIFPHSPILKISNPIGKHDEDLLENFLATFENPKLIGSFPQAEKAFSIDQIKNINLEEESPLVLVRIWDSRIEDLENIQAILGKNVGIILFER